VTSGELNINGGSIIESVVEISMVNRCAGAGSTSIGPPAPTLIDMKLDRLPVDHFCE
jgi:hypothetical protein